MLDVILQCLAIDHDIIEVHGAKNIKVWAKGFIDILLEYCTCICEPKGHDQGFKEAIAGAYDFLLDIFISYLDKAIGIANSNFGDIFTLNNWANVSVIDGRRYSSFIVP
jgi:hypothetical protein